MKVLIAAFGTRGDVQPALALAVRLLQAGYEALVTAAENFEAPARSLGVPFHASSSDLERFMSQQGHTLSSPRKSSQAMLTLLRTEATRTFHETRLAAERLGADVVVGTSLQLAAPSVAEVLGVPYRALVYQPQALPSSYWPPFLMKRQTWPRWLNRLMWDLNLVLFAGMLKPLIQTRRQAWGLPPVKDVFAHLRGKHPLVASARALAPLAPDLDAEPLHVGALELPVTGQTLPPEVESFLQAGAPPIYIGFGSMPDDAAAATTRHIVAAVKQAGVRAIIGSGWAGLGQGLDDDEHFCVVKEVPHAPLFPRLAAVVHHGGAGTTYAVARAGVPQLVVPHILDQFFWGHHVHQRGLGPEPLRREALRKGLLGQRLSALLGTAAYAEQARRVAEELAREDGGATILRELEALVAARPAPGHAAPGS